MIQTVGIKFEAQGLDVVTGQMRALAASVGTLVRSITRLEKLNTSAAVSNLNQLAAGMGNAAARLVFAANQINAATSAFTAANAAIGRASAGGGVPSVISAPGTKTQTSQNTPKGYLGETLVTTGRLLRYSAAFGALYGTKEAAAGLLGADRADMAEAGFRLSGVGIRDRADKRKIEKDVTDFLIKNPYMGTISEGVAGAAEMASAIPFNDPKYPALSIDLLNKMNRMNMVYAKLSEMTPKQAADSGVLAMNAIMASKSKEEQGEYYTQPGKLESLYDQVLGMQQKAVDISKITGQGIAEFNKHALPILLKSGWNYESSLAVAAAETDVGLRTSSGGRAMKNLYTHEDKIGLLMALGSPDEKYYKKLSSMKKEAQLEEGYRYFQEVKKWSKGDAPKMLDMASDARDRAASRGVNVQKLISTEFAQYIEELLDKTFIDKLKNHYIKQIGQDWLTAPQREAITDQSQADENPRWARLTQRMDALMKSLGDTPSGGGPNAVNGLYAAADGVIDVLGLLATAATDPMKALHQLTFALGSAALEISGAFKTKETAAAEDSAYITGGQRLIEKAQTRWALPFEDKTGFTPVPGFSMFNVPNFNNIDPSPSLRSATSEEQKTMHEVKGQAEVEVKINDQGFFDKVRALVQLYPHTQSGDGLANSTGRHAPVMTQ